MKVRTFEDDSIVAQSFRLKKECEAKGKPAQYFDLSVLELATLVKEGGLPAGFVPETLHGIPVRIEGMPSSEWKAYQKAGADWQQATQITQAFIRKMQGGGQS